MKKIRVNSGQPDESGAAHEVSFEEKKPYGGPHWGELCSEFSGASPAAGEAAEGDGEGEGEGAERLEEGEERTHPH